MLLPAISQFLSGSVTDTLKNILRPATLFSAAVFVFLNLIFVLSPLQQVESAVGTFADTILGLNIVWLAAIATVLSIILAYVLNSLNGTIYGFMTGESWENAYLVGWAGKQLQKLRWESILNDTESMSDSLVKNRLKYEFRTHFPANADYIAPTALGNVITAHASILWDRYKIDLTALWPHMQAAIADKADLKASIDNEKAGLDFLLTLSFTIMIFVIECLLLNVLGVTIPLLGWHYLFFLLLAYGLYRACVVKAVTWGQAILVAFDLNQGTLREKLAMQSFENRKAARERWGLISRHLLYGTVPENQVDQLFDETKEAESSSATAAVSPNVAVVFQHDKIDLKKPLTVEFDVAQGNGVHHYASEIRYLILVSNVSKENVESDSWPVAKGVFVVVDEPRVAWIDATPSGGSDWTAQIAAPTRLLWQLKRELRTNEAVKLEYSLPGVIWAATSDHPQLKIIADNDSITKESDDYVIRLHLKNISSTALTDCEIEVFDSRITDHKGYESPKGALELQSPIGYRFKVSRIEAGITLPLLKRIKPKSA